MKINKLFNLSVLALTFALSLTIATDVFAAPNGELTTLTLDQNTNLVTLSMDGNVDVGAVQVFLDVNEGEWISFTPAPAMNLELTNLLDTEFGLVIQLVGDGLIGEGSSFEVGILQLTTGAPVSIVRNLGTHAATNTLHTLLLEELIPVDGENFGILDVEYVSSGESVTDVFDTPVFNQTWSGIKRLFQP